MQNQVLQSGWKQLASDENQDYLYKSFQISNFASALSAVESIGKTILTAKLDKTTHLSLDTSSITVSLNYPSKTPLTDDHYKLALGIDKLIEATPA